MSFSLGKFVDHAQESVDFDRYGIPVPEVATYLVGALELVGGCLLIVGLFTRPAAALLAANLVGAIATAGRVDGGTLPPRRGPGDARRDAVPGVGGFRPPRARPHARSPRAGRAERRAALSR